MPAGQRADRPANCPLTPRKGFDRTRTGVSVRRSHGPADLLLRAHGRRLRLCPAEGQDRREDRRRGVPRRHFRDDGSALVAGRRLFVGRVGDFRGRRRLPSGVHLRGADLRSILAAVGQRISAHHHLRPPLQGGRFRPSAARLCGGAAILGLSDPDHARSGRLAPAEAAPSGSVAERSVAAAAGQRR